MRGNIRLGIGIMVISVAAACTAEGPYPASPVIAGVKWESSSDVVRNAVGSDNWPMTWARDDFLYAAWGDGKGFGDRDAGLGVARIEGPPEEFKGFNMWSVPRSFEGGKSHGILSVDGVLYMWVGPHSNWTSSTQTRLMWSHDQGKTWERTGVFFRFTDGFSLPTFLSFGKDHSGSRDHYVYVYSADKSAGEHGPWTDVVLARVANDLVLSRSNYEFFSGVDAHGTPVWDEKVANRAPIFHDPNGVGSPFVIYNPGIGRYLMVLPHIIADRGPGYGSLGIFDAPEPWGPWGTVYYTERFLGSTTLFFATIPTKQPDWLSTDGSTFHLVFSGFGEIAKDAYNAVRGRLILRNDQAARPD